jgi:hypothetical protein
MRFEVRFSPEAEQDLAQLLDALLAPAETLDDLVLADAAMAAIRSATSH